MALTPDETKEALKQALKEWLDEKATLFGWWAARTLGAAALSAVVYFILQMNGWKKFG